MRWKASQKHLMVWREQSANISNGHLIYFSKNDVSLLSQTLLSVLIQNPVHCISTPSRPCPLESLAATALISNLPAIPPTPGAKCQTSDSLTQHVGATAEPWSSPMALPKPLPGSLCLRLRKDITQKLQEFH